MNENFTGLNNLYEILQVQPNACQEVIKASYRALQRKYHPDISNSGNLSSLVNQAKEIILDPQKRSSYDQQLRESQQKMIGNYQVISQISQGSMGVTYKANHVLLNEFACLKQNINISPEDTIVMAHEAKLLWKLHHYSLPTLRDYFKLDDGSCVFAMTYIEGPTIDKIVEKHGGIDPEHVCWMTQRLLNALNYLHFNGVVHCDVKPNNIIVKPQEHNAVLVDYGFSSIKPRSYTKPTGYTLAFAAPELIDLKPPMPHTDLYSLAATMIYALGGNPIDKSYPTNTPEKIKTFFNQFMHDHPLARPSWEDKDLVKELSDLRQQIFGRKQSNKEMRV